MQRDDQKRLSLSEVAQELDVNISTPWRWHLTGVRGVRLETHLIGGRRYVTRAALDKFLDSINQGERKTETRSGPSTLAGHELSKHGI